MLWDCVVRGTLSACISWPHSQAHPSAESQVLTRGANSINLGLVFLSHERASHSKKIEGCDDVFVSARIKTNQNVRIRKLPA